MVSAAITLTKHTWFKRPVHLCKKSRTVELFQLNLIQLTYNKLIWITNKIHFQHRHEVNFGPGMCIWLNRLYWCLRSNNTLLQLMSCMVNWVGKTQPPWILSRKMNENCISLKHVSVYKAYGFYCYFLLANMNHWDLCATLSHVSTLSIFIQPLVHRAYRIIAPQCYC